MNADAEAFFIIEIPTNTVSEELAARIQGLDDPSGKKYDNDAEAIVPEPAIVLDDSRPVLSTLSLASCGGCVLSLLGDTEGFLSFFGSDQVQIGFSHMFTDAQTIPRSDLLLVEGGVRTDEHVQLLRRARAKARTIVAFGTCATHGGIPALSNLYTLRELLSSIYDSDIEVFQDHLTPRESLGAVDEFIDVDWYLPGCPPPIHHSLELLPVLLRNGSPEVTRSIVCRECQRKIVPQAWPPETMEEIALKKPEPGLCLVSQGFFCLGSVTRSGCGAPCPRIGYPCSGCRTASDAILRKHDTHALDAVAELMAKRTKLSVELIKHRLVASSLFYHAFTVVIEPRRMKNPDRIL